MKKYLIYFLSLFTLASCSKQNLAYFNDLPEQSTFKEQIKNITEPAIQPDDILSITVNSLNQQSNALFNKEVVDPAGRSVAYAGSNNYIADAGYLVDQEGFIDFPVLGRIKLSGLTKQQAKDELIKRLKNYLKEPTVNIRFLNFRVTVIGEVDRPSTLTIPSEKINVLEALGMAGDMTVYGKRENVLVIREAGGIRTMTRLDLTKKDAFNSPYFYLKQNDVVYVEPNKLRQSVATTDTRFVTIALAATSTITLVIWRLFLR